MLNHLEYRIFNVRDIISSFLAFFSSPRQLHVDFAKIHQSLCFCNFCLHLHDQYPQRLLAFLASVDVDVAGVLFAVGPFGKIAAFKEMVFDLTDAARSGRVDFSYVGLGWKTTMVDAFGCGAGSPKSCALPIPQSIFRAAACCISEVECV